METEAQLISKHLAENINDKSLYELILNAWSLKQDISGNAMDFYKPIRTVAVSVTGSECELNCAHCGGHYLKAMVPIGNAIQEAVRIRASSCLISGGCSSNGKVELKYSTDKIRELKGIYKINLHAGLLKDEDIEEVSRMADVVSLDMPASDRIIREVYGLRFSTDDYIDMYLRLREKVKVIPHICIGLDEGIEPGLSILDVLPEINPQNLCFIVFIPTSNTRFENRRPPEIFNVIKVLASARLRLPHTNIVLGCMRPGGIYRRTLDNLAIVSGINGLVMPAQSAVTQAELMGIEAVWKEECCAF